MSAPSIWIVGILAAAFLLTGASASKRVSRPEGATKNPFLGQDYFVNPYKASRYDASIESCEDSDVKTTLKKMRGVPAATWIDSKNKLIGDGPESVTALLRGAAKKSELLVMVWYNLPNRDCDAKASEGEFCCVQDQAGKCDYLAEQKCTEGLTAYKTEYVDPFVALLQEYQNKVPVAIILEPDALPNLATNAKYPKCGSQVTQDAYARGIQYAMVQLTTKVPKVAVYLDAAHGGWMGWTHNTLAFVKKMKAIDLPYDKIRGFSTNVANYQPLGVQCPWEPDMGMRNGYCLNNKNSDDPCCYDPCDLESQYNPGNNEMNYAAGLVEAANSILDMEAHVIIDTGRNGIIDQRRDCANWCNPRFAGAGIPATTETANKSLVDAYFWLKTPGESDGCSKKLPNGTACARFDEGCASADSLGLHPDEDRAPEAGEWYDFQAKQLAQCAQFDLPNKTNKVGRFSSAQCNKQKKPKQDEHVVVKTDAQEQSTVESDVADKADASDKADAPDRAKASDKADSPHEAEAAGHPKAKSTGPCQPVWQQCGGKTWTGPTCCKDGSTCSENGGSYYSQCVPDTKSVVMKKYADNVDGEVGMQFPAPLWCAGAAGTAFLAVVAAILGVGRARGKRVRTLQYDRMPLPADGPSHGTVLAEEVA